MSVPATGSDPTQDSDDFTDPDDEALSEETASDPEAARKEAEDALARIEELADLDEEPDLKSDVETGEERSSASEDVEQAARSDKTEPEDRCKNCGAPLHGPYCSQCGQRAADRILPVWQMVNEGLETVVDLDLRVFRTFPTFFFLPGRLTKEYLNGRRKRYVHPFRLCLFATFLVFAVIAFTTSGSFSFILDPQGSVRLNPPNTAITASSGTGSTAAAASSSFFGSPEERERMARNIESDSTGIQIDFFDDPKTNERAERILRTKTAQAVRNPRAFVNSMIDRGPYLMFLMLPIFALLLKLLYIRRGRLYMEHMIFSLHMHAFTFFAFTFGLLLEQSGVEWLRTVGTWIEIAPLLYLVLAMRHVYEQGFIKTTIKVGLLLFIYMIILSVGVVLLFIVAILLM